MTTQFIHPCRKQASVILSGIGGWEVGLMEAGWEMQTSTENDVGKLDVLRRNFRHSVISCMPESPVRDGLFVIGGLPEHSCEGPFWDSCMQAVVNSEARWVVLETVHTVLRTNPWPGAMGRIQKDFHDAGYTTLWCIVIYGCREPVIRWSRLIVIGWPMGWGIPSQLSTCHAQALLMNDVEMAVNVQRGQTYPRHAIPEWTKSIGFPAQWLQVDERQEEYLTVATVPTVATNIGRMILSADQYLMQLVEQGEYSAL